ncbi:MAG TPA: hypothetical protein PKA63_13580 [Oligoflexia bacterium]|nr:hypothetical protein [Oligoflexia bacterium]HMP49693.1 hypothetical protein [Oligoflexia bacterium]
MSGIERIDFSRTKGHFETVNVSNESRVSFKDKFKALEARRESLSDGLKQGLEQLESSWKTSYGQSFKLLQNLPVEFKPLLEMQMNMSKVHFQTELVTKVGDSVQSTLKRLQQQGG